MHYLVRTAREEIPPEISAHCRLFDPDRDEPILTGMNFLPLRVCAERDLQDELCAFLEAGGYPAENCFELTPSEGYPGEWVLDIEPAPYPTMTNAGRVLSDPERTDPKPAFSLGDPAFYARLCLFLDLLNAQIEKSPILLEEASLPLSTLECETLDEIFDNAHRSYGEGDGTPVLYLI